MGRRAAKTPKVDDPPKRFVDRGLDVRARAKLDFSVSCDKTLKILQQNKRAPIALASYPGSGSTWTRHLLQKSTGYATGSVYLDSALMEQFPFEGVKDNSMIAVKTHYPCAKCWFVPKTKDWVSLKQSAGRQGGLKRVSAVLYVIRSPFDAILAEYQRQVTGLNHTGVLPRAHFVEHNSSWHEAVEFRYKSWLEHVTYWRSAFKNRLEVPFEELQSDFEVQASAMIDFVKKNVDVKNLKLPSKEAMLECARDAGSFKRDHRERFNPYTPVQRRKLCEAFRPVWLERVWGKCDGRLQWERI